jgi:hypothetical protein
LDPSTYLLFPICRFSFGFKSAPRFAPATDLIGFRLLLNPLNFFGFIGILDLLGEAREISHRHL